MDHKFKSKWESSNSLLFDHKDYDNIYGYDEISWRQRNFMCNFCKKEYKSAQALGGHMNVHRRDRARLRLSSPSHHDHPANPNPNPNFSSSSMRCLPYKTSYHSCLFPLSSSSTTSKEGKQEMFPLVPHSERNFLGSMKKKIDYVEGNVASVGGGFHGNYVHQESEFRAWKKREGAFGVEMEMGLIKDGSKIGMELDLELRLGRSESI
ncbi:hypothetical protein OSB04_023250 [Centaurea solstitialis]|uniref:C2H2-type domain-containing protein n=1 Tax=Centaurea solstitialis TaxID=347529 RepID=A0AA38SRB4_9ASTR|nr:hypothetical protein OSB04_023250 [Centaurea solstitialis]